MKFADFDNHFGPQCKDLFSFYNRDVVGNPDYVYGDAWELYNVFPTKYYRVTTQTPQKGDVAIWKKEFGGYGHVAIVWDNGLFFSQNYPLGTQCVLRKIPTTQLQGYLRPLKFDPMDTEYDNHIIRTEKGRFAYVKGGTGKKQLITRENAGLAMITYLQRIPTSVHPKDWINNVSDEKWNEYEEVPDGTWF